MSDVPRILQRLVLTIQSSVLTADVFQLFIKQRMTDPTSTTSGETMNKYDTTAVATTTSVSKIQLLYGILHHHQQTDVALIIPQQHVIHQASNQVDITDTRGGGDTLSLLCKLLDFLLVLDSI